MKEVEMEYPLLDTGLDFNTLLRHALLVADWRERLSDTPNDPDDNLFLQLSEREVGILSLALTMMSLLVEDLESDVVALMNKVASAIEVQKLNEEV
jgi:hypothetical protein